MFVCVRENASSSVRATHGVHHGTLLINVCVCLFVVVCVFVCVLCAPRTVSIAAR